MAGVAFLILGGAIIVQIVRTAGLSLQAVPGLAFGAAMVALGLVRTVWRPR